jgi:hypothetical protein
MTPQTLEGASGPQIAEAMGWAPHTVRGCLAGLAKKGTTVEVLDRIHQVGPDKQGAKGSYSIYRVGQTAEPEPMRPAGQCYAVRLYQVSAPEQGHSGLGLEVQQTSVRVVAQSRAGR